MEKKEMVIGIILCIICFLMTAFISHLLDSKNVSMDLMKFVLEEEIDEEALYDNLIVKSETISDQNDTEYVINKEALSSLMLYDNVSLIINLLLFFSAVVSALYFMVQTCLYLLKKNASKRNEILTSGVILLISMVLLSFNNSVLNSIAAIMFLLNGLGCIAELGHFFNMLIKQ